MTEWLVRQGQSAPIGPVSTDLVLKGIRAGRVSPQALVCRVGDTRWFPISAIRELGGVPVEDDAETNVTDKPWFATQTAVLPSQPRPSHPNRLSHPDRPSGLGLSAPRRELISSPSHPRPRPPAPPPQSTTLVAGQGRYDEADDDAATRVATPHDELAEPPDYQVDDETMTRVARSPAGAPPRTGSPAAKNVLPTMPMSQVLERGPVVSPRPAAGMPPAPAHHDILPPTQPFGPQAQGGAPYGMPGAFPPVAAMPPTQPPMQLPYGTLPPMTPQQPPGQGMYPQYPQPPPPQPPADQGLRALVALIIFLAVALAIVVLLLVMRK